MFPALARSDLRVSDVAPIRPRLRVVRGGEAGAFSPIDDFLAYLNRVKAEWTLLSEWFQKPHSPGELSGPVWQQFTGEAAAFSQFYTANKSPIMPWQDTTDLDWWAARAKAWDDNVKGYAGAGAGLPGLPAGGEKPHADPFGLATVGDALRGAGWLLVAGLAVYLVMKYAPEPRKAR